mgnify:CR=1 FL=1
MLVSSILECGYIGPACCLRPLQWQNAQWLFKAPWRALYYLYFANTMLLKWLRQTNLECLSNAAILKQVLMFLNNVITFACIWEAVWYSHICCAAAAIYSTLLSKVLCLSLKLICRYRELFLHPTSAEPIKVEDQAGCCAWHSSINWGGRHR